MRTARGGRTASVITTAALLGALAFPSAAGATEILEAPASEATPTAVAPALEPTPTPVDTSDPEPTSTPEATAEPVAAPIATEAPVTAPPAPSEAPVAVAPVLTLPRTDFVAGAGIIGDRSTGWGDGLDVVGSGFAPGSSVVVALMDGPTPEARTTVVSSANGEVVLDDWFPGALDGGFSLYPHLPRPGEQITVVASATDAAGVQLTSNAVVLTITQPDPAVSFVLAEDGSPFQLGSDVNVAAFRVFGIAALLRGFDRDEDVTTTLTAPDGSVTTIANDVPGSALYGETSFLLDESTMVDQFGTFTVTGVGASSGRTVSASLVQVPDKPGIRIWPVRAPLEPSAPDVERTSGGAVFGFTAGERVSVSIHSLDGTRQRLVDGGTRLDYTVDTVGWSLIALGEYPLADPEPEIYCVVALGTTSGRTATAEYDYGRSVSDPVDCSAAEAAARAGSGAGSGVTAGRPVLAATGVSPSAPLALAAFGILGGLALMITRRRRA
ncbi:hypothetical protein C1I63_07160 [Rathayibacter caricis DSM 15933]|uniref:Gram-positive cocci surface proteins LPxTG domain-containing protein n=1 Tax=Rathayibacter caricis DSM 15933 TaxID=1328867 RepID=A0A2T4UT11_9MICO|nr:LPXTG cell wall anchor domain-containing protein [Rathayibacter caricis]PTL72646.1 hypothetical protein C1I63_07160 [Rathayibacter caricis DSM 15933]